MKVQNITDQTIMPFHRAGEAESDYIMSDQNSAATPPKNTTDSDLPIKLYTSAERMFLSKIQTHQTNNVVKQLRVPFVGEGYWMNDTETRMLTWKESTLYLYKLQPNLVKVDYDLKLDLMCIKEEF